MTNGRDDPTGSGAGAGGYHSIQAGRDLVSNWEVDIADRLEDYLLKICSGEITEESQTHIPVNFAEAALLLQGSVQVYSRKVEYLYSLVLRALEFLSQKRQEEQLEGTSDQAHDNAGAKDNAREEDDDFWNVDDIPEEAKISLDSRADEESHLNNIVKPPANLVVFEGDCLDSGGDAGELESYLLATCDLYRGFLLLDPCDAVAADDYLDGDIAARGKNSVLRGSTARKSFQSPIAHSGGASHKSSIRKGQDENAKRTPIASSNENNPPAPSLFSDGGFDVDDRNSIHGEFDGFDDEDEDDDPWKPLNPHEPGNLKVKPFRKVKAPKRTVFVSRKQVSTSSLFPLAKVHGPIRPEFRIIWEMQNQSHVNQKRRRESEFPPLYEKLLQQLFNDESQTFLNSKQVIEEDETDLGVPEFDQPDDDIPDFMDEDRNEERNGDGHFGVDDPFGYEDANIQSNLEDLCRSHLDALLASIAETEKQSELAARVSTWKQNIEKNLDDQDSHPEFDIHRYGDKILDRLSVDSDVLSFTDLVKDDVKYDVARSFSALLQLVNNGEVELNRNGIDDSVCFTATNPFQVRLLKNVEKKQPQFHLSRKRVKSPVKKPVRNSETEEKLGQHTPEGKIRRKSRLVGLR